MTQLSSHSSEAMHPGRGVLAPLWYALALSLLVCLCGQFLIAEGQAHAFASYACTVLLLISLSQPQTRAALMKLLRADTGRSLWVLTALFVWLAISTLWHGTGHEPTLLQALGWTFLAVTFVTALILCLNHLPWFFPLLTWSILFAASVTALLALQQHTELHGEGAAWWRTRLTGSGRLHNSAVAAMSMGAAWSLSLALLYQRIIAKQFSQAALLVLLMLPTSLMLLLAQTRSVWLACCLCLLAMICYALKDAESRHKFLLLGSTLTVSAAAIYFWHGPLVQVIERAQLRGASYRDAIWQQIFDNMGIGAWLIGNGFADSRRIEVEGLRFKHAHNLFIGTLEAGGLIAVTLLVSLLVLIFARLKAGTSGQSYRSPAAMVLLFSIAVLMLDGGVPLGKINQLWLMLLFPIALALSQETRTTPSA